MRNPQITLLTIHTRAKANNVMRKKNTAKNQKTINAPKILIDTIQQLEKKNEALRKELWRYKRKPAGRIGYLLLFVGATSLIWSLISTSYVPAFIGIALIFWGALLLFMRPTKYIRADLLSSTSLPTFTTINKMIRTLDYKGKGIYLPPKHPRGFKSGKLFISLKEDIVTPSTEKIAEDEVFLTNPRGMCLTPSGQDLTNLFESELGFDFTEVDLTHLQTSLPKLFIEGLEIAEDFEMNMRGNTIHVKIFNSIYKDFCSRARKLSKKVCNSFACPLCSSIACALTRVTGKPIVIEKRKVSSKGEKVEVDYQIIEE